MNTLLKMLNQPKKSFYAFSVCRKRSDVSMRDGCLHNTSGVLQRFICLKLTPILVGSLFIAGCRTLPVVPHAISCDVSAELLASKCLPPRQIADDATFATLVDTMQADRQALRECGVTADALIETIKHCNQAIEEFNKKIDAINSAK